MWDAVLASVPAEAAFAPPRTPPTVSADTLALYAGTYEFAAVPEQPGGAFSGLGIDVAIEDGLVRVSPIDGAPAARAGVMLDKMRGPSGSKAELTITREGQDRPLEIGIVREPIRLRSLLRVQVQGDGLAVEAIGGRQVFEFQPAKPRAVIPYSDTEFYVDGRYHTRIAFTRDATGKVLGAVLNPGRWQQKGVRID
jgi:hypothetical protein